jgi:hypothetical protein
VGRADVLAAMGVLGGLLMYIKSTEATGWRQFAWLAGLMAATAIGVCSKESAVMMVGVIALYELTWWHERKALRPLVLGCLAAMLPIAAMLYQRASVLRAAAPAEFPFTDNPISAAGFWTGRLTAVQVMARYLRLAVWPAQLSVDYSYSEIPLARGSLGDWVAWIIVAAAAVGVVMLYRRNRTAFFFAAFAFITFLPTANLLFPIGTIMADRFLYLPSVGLVACIVLAIYAAQQRIAWKAFAPVLLCLIAFGFAARTWVRNLDWKDDLTVVSAGVRASPDSYKVHKVLGSLLYASDGFPSNIDRVSEEAGKTLSILDPLPDALNDADAWRWSGGFFLAKGDALRDRGQDGAASYQRARQVLLRCISICLVHDRRGEAVVAAEPEAYRLLSAVYLRLGDISQAAKAADSAIALDPLNPDAYRQTARVLVAKQIETPRQ